MRLRYQTLEFGETDIHLCTLRDRQEFTDPDGEAEALGISSAQWPLFGVLWKAAPALAEHMLDVDLADHRILEVGCGIGLASLILNHRGADITAMDYHPEAGAFLDRNTALNGDPAINFLQSDWTRHDARLGKFSMIIGSDLLYEEEHASSLAEFVERHRTDNCTVVMTDPGRGYRGRFASAMQDNGFRYEHESISGVRVMTFSLSGNVRDSG